MPDSDSKQKKNLEKDFGSAFEWKKKAILIYPILSGNLSPLITAILSR